MLECYNNTTTHVYVLFRLFYILELRSYFHITRVAPRKRLKDASPLVRQPGVWMSIPSDGSNWDGVSRPSTAGGARGGLDGGISGEPGDCGCHVGERGCVALKENPLHAPPSTPTGLDDGVSIKHKVLKIEPPQHMFHFTVETRKMKKTNEKDNVNDKTIRRGRWVQFRDLQDKYADK